MSVFIRGCYTTTAENLRDSTLFPKNAAEYNYLQPYHPPAPVKITPEFENFWARIEKSKKGSVQVAEWWMSGGQGTPLTKGLMRSVLLKMCSCAWFAEARKLAFWMDQAQLFQLSDSDLMLRMEILCRTGYWNAARLHFENLERKTEAAYVLLLDAFGAHLLTPEAESLVAELKASELPPSTRVYAALFKFYARLRRHEAASRVFKKFRSSGLDFDASMCWAVLSDKNVFRFPEDAEIRDQVGAAVTKLKVDANNVLDLLRVNVALGNAAGVCRVWEEMKQMCPAPMVLECISASNALEILGELEKAKEPRSEIESRSLSMNYQDNLMLLKLYARNGMMQEAESLQERLMQFKVKFELCQPLVDGYIRLKKFENAIQCFEKFVRLGKDVLVPPRLVGESMVKLIGEVYSRRRDIQGAEQMLASVPEIRDVSIYNALILLYRRCHEPGYELESRPDFANVEKKTRTRCLLFGLRRRFPTSLELDLGVDSMNRPLKGQLNQNNLAWTGSFRLSKTEQVKRPVRRKKRRSIY